MTITSATTSGEIRSVAWDLAVNDCLAAGIGDLWQVDELGNERPVPEIMAAFLGRVEELEAHRDSLRAAAAEAGRAAAARWAPRPQRQRRRHFSPRILERYPLTQPPNRCQRCGYVDEGALELDHMYEVHLGGPDHPHNLLRLCGSCHRAKPYLPELESLVEARLAIITWAHSRPMLRWWPVEEIVRFRAMKAEARR